MKKLVIVESPAKAKTIQTYLGKGYTVKSSKGHIVDLPKSGLAVDVDDSYKPEYVVTKPSVLKDLKKAYKGADVLVLAVDPDREGEAIGWHVAQQLGAITPAGNPKKGKKIERIVFTEITKAAVQAAAQQPREIMMDLVHAQQARRVLDRLVGYKLSPLLWKKIRYGLSAGRVQSVAVRLIVDRERERDKFKPDEYWSVKTCLDTKKSKKDVVIEYLLKKDKDEDEEQEGETKDAEVTCKHIEFDLVKKNGKKLLIQNQKEAQSVVTALKEYEVSKIERKAVQKKPGAPFTTSSMQQVAAGKLGFTARRTMQAAQKLYEAGLITYMRTDSVTISSQTVAKMRKHIGSKYGDKYLPAKPNVYKTKSKSAQEAHEAIRPTAFGKTSGGLGLASDQARLYDLIATRALASQMTPAQLEQHKIFVESGEYELQAVGRQIKFPGYLKVYSETVSESELPDLKQGQEMFAHGILAKQHFTQPPARFSEASLVKELERLGIGRPSTYASIIHTIQQRKYVEKLSAYFYPTDTGYVVTDLLVKYFSDVVDTGFTSEMEDNLDEIADGKREWVKVIDAFYKPFAKNLETNEEKIKRDEFTVLGKSDMKCPECGKPMVIKLGRYGRFLSCSTFPDCKGMLSMDGESEEDIMNKVKTDDFKQTYEPAPKTDEGKDYILKRGRFGEFWAHPEYPKVKDAQPLQYLPEKLEEIYGEVPKTDDGRPYLVKKGRFGEFWAHPDYPKVKDIVKMKKKKD